MSSSSSAWPSRLVIAVGTYDGVLAGWEKNTKEEDLKLTFATPVHEGSLRNLCMAPSLQKPGTLVSCGYDEYLKIHDWQKRLTGSGEVRTPADFGTPTSVEFCLTSHVMVGFGSGKLVLYKKRDWSIQHVLGGHEGGVAGLAVHPSGKMALSSGTGDNKLKLWDLTRGRLAFTNKVSSTSHPICSVVWSHDGQAYAWANGNHVTVRHVGTGKDLVSVDLPSRVNQITLMDGQEGLFVAAACNDGSLPVLAAQDMDEEESTRRAIMAIEPVDSVVAGEERFKCIRTIRGFLVATANSAGVVSVMDLSGAVRMIMGDDEQEINDGNSSEEHSQDNDRGDSDEDELDLAVDILESVRLGTGARITSLAVWCWNDDDDNEKDQIIESNQEECQKQSTDETQPESNDPRRGTKRKAVNEVEIDAQGVAKARALVNQAKKIKHKKDKKKSKKIKEKNRQG